MVLNYHQAKPLAEERSRELRRGIGPRSREQAASSKGRHGGRTNQPEATQRITALVSAAAEGDERAWDGLMAQFGGLVWAIARAHRLNDADASDVCQATWLRLFEHLRRLQEPAAVGAWLATTARRECLRVLRENQRRVLHWDDDHPDYESLQITPDEAVLVRARDDALRLSFSQLRASDQALLRVLVADPRPPYDQIAAALDMPIGSIGPTRQRALERLRHELDAQGTLTLMHD
jgi:RNA polymerase sigma factor (sigma-70 family)